jgi:hypothetical protein
MRKNVAARLVAKALQDDKKKVEEYEQGPASFRSQQSLHQNHTEFLKNYGQSKYKQRNLDLQPQHQLINQVFFDDDTKN